MAYNLVQTLKSLAANESRTILCSIHQPSSQCFFSFDKLLLLADGHVCFLTLSQFVICDLRLG